MSKNKRRSGGGAAEQPPPAAQQQPPAEAMEVDIDDDANLSEDEEGMSRIGLIDVKVRSY